MWKTGSELPAPEQPPFPEEEMAVIEKLARKTVDRGMSIPAILFLESVKPLNFIGSQILVFFEPIVQTVFNFKDYETFRTALERRDSIEVLIQQIEGFDAKAQREERAFKKWYRLEKKKWTWSQRYFGIRRPKLNPPDEVLNPPEPGASTSENESPTK